MTSFSTRHLSRVLEVKWVPLVLMAEMENQEIPVPLAFQDLQDPKESGDSEESQDRGGRKEKLGHRGLLARLEPMEIPVFLDPLDCLDLLDHQATLYVKLTRVCVCLCVCVCVCVHVWLQGMIAISVVCMCVCVCVATGHGAW